MIGYITIGTNDLEKAAKFYDELFILMDAKRMMEDDSFIAWCINPGEPAFSVTKPFDKKEATVGNGVMIALAAKNIEHVQAIHKKALELGATDEGAPGPRGEGGFYAGYFRDFDGNKINTFCMTGSD